MVIDSSAGFDEPAKVKAIFSVFGDQGIVFANSLNGKSEQEISRQIDKLIQNSEDEDFIAESVDYDVDLPNKKASVTITGKAVTSWGDAEDFRETQLDQLNIGRNFYRERKEEDYEDYSATPLWTDASFTVAEVEGPAIYKRKVEQEGNIVRGSLSTNIARGTYLPVAAKIWDKKTDDMFDDKVYIAIFGDNAAAAKRFANYDSNIKEAGSLADNGQLQAAANILNPLIDSDPNNVKLLVARGRIGQDAGMQERDLLRALLIEPSNMDALRTIAEVYLEQDNISLGKAMLERIIKKDKDHVWAKEQMDDIRSKNKDG
jgi:tetratricopeptide (TPR) repeat protein